LHWHVRYSSFCTSPPHLQGTQVFADSYVELTSHHEIAGAVAKVLDKHPGHTKGDDSLSQQLSTWDVIPYATIITCRTSLLLPSPLPAVIKFSVCIDDAWFVDVSDSESDSNGNGGANVGYTARGIHGVNGSSGMELPSRQPDYSVGEVEAIVERGGAFYTSAGPLTALPLSHEPIVSLSNVRYASSSRDSATYSVFFSWGYREHVVCADGGVQAGESAIRDLFGEAGIHSAGYVRGALTLWWYIGKNVNNSDKEGGGTNKIQLSQLTSSAFWVLWKTGVYLIRKLMSVRAFCMFRQGGGVRCPPPPGDVRRVPGPSSVTYARLHRGLASTE
jgi:hypothetical protein